ncbi:MAG: hypothetical protein ONB06_10615, partial [candidate division KSB1 bacterium]|nr:hypothetical protein [candidate division KSB1 bacterium]
MRNLSRQFVSALPSELKSQVPEAGGAVARDTVPDNWWPMPSSKRKSLSVHSALLGSVGWKLAFS